MGNGNRNNRKPISPSLRYSVMKRDDFTCQLCGKKGLDNTRLEIDHILPVAEGGTNNPDNLRTLCFECNRGRVIDIDHQAIFRFKTQEKSIKDRESENDELDKRFERIFGFPQPEPYSLIRHGSHYYSLWHQIKAIFKKPNPWGTKTIYDEETKEWIKVESGPAAYVFTWRELFEEKMHYKWRRFQSAIYQFFFTIPNKIPIKEVRGGNYAN